MKRFFFIIPLILLSIIIVAVDQQDNNIITQKYSPALHSESSETYKTPMTDYRMDVKFNTTKKVLDVSEQIVWRNLTEFETNELQFHLYANAFSNNKTELAKKNYLTEEEKTKYEITHLSVNGKQNKFIYFQPEVENEFDSTVAKILMDEPISSGDSVIIEIKYRLKVPKSTVRFGYASGREFYFISQWFPKLGVFEGGNWTCSQYHPYTEFYSDFANYEVSISLPKNSIVGSTGEQKVTEVDSLKEIKISAKNVIDFAWTASTEFISLKEIYKSDSGKDIEIQFLLQPENSGLKDRMISAATNTLKFMEENIGEYPYSKITLVDVPRSSNLGGMEYPGIITFFTPLFTPIEIQTPESTIIHEIVHQYFYAALSSNEVYEGWLDEGITTYLEQEILLQYYGKPELYFRFIDYYPIFGLQFLSFNEIPLIYTLRSFDVDQYAYNLAAYYENRDLGDLMTKSYLLPDFRAALVNVYSRPVLLLQTLKNYIGKQSLLKILSEYYNQNKFTLVNKDKFINKLYEFENRDLSWFIDNYILQTHKFDYKLSYISQQNDSTYKIFVERLEEGVSPTEIAVYTEVDTTFIKWNGEERWKEIMFVSPAKVIAAEIDPHRKIIMDVNYANNSYIIEQKYWASLSIAIRWFLWIQNGLLIFGSIG